MALIFNFEVHTPYRLFFYGKAQAVILQLIDGEICVYANHSPFTSLSISGQLQIKDEEGMWRSAFIAKGILEVKEHKNVLMVDAAEWPEEIDKTRAIKSKEEAEKALKDTNFRFEIDKSKEKLRRANYRLKVANGD